MPSRASRAAVWLLAGLPSIGCSSSASSGASAAADGGGSSEAQAGQDAGGGSTTDAIASTDAIATNDAIDTADAIGTADAIARDAAGDAARDATGASGLAFTPWILLDAEHGTLGSKYEGNGSDQWTSASGDTLIDDTFVFEGKQSFKMHANKGTPNNGGEYGTWGGIKELPTLLHKGDVIHLQVALYLPTTFDWTANPWLKFMRVPPTMASDGTTNHGYNDIYIYNQHVTPGQDGQLNSIYEGAQVWASSTAVLQKGSWQVAEFEVTFDDVSVDKGGQGRTRLWLWNGGGSMTLTLDRTDSATLTDATDQVDGFYLFTYWNSGSEDGTYPTQAQDCWADRIVIEKDMSKLVETDSHGNKVIGGV